ncbi:MAG TPA: amidase [Acidimicrobiales bacterium]|nr:amidase [Acidimicrobiales bacterium]
MDDALDAYETAALVQRGDASPIEVVDAAIARIEKLNPELNAVVFERFDKARAEAASLPDGPLRGVPWVVKDLDVQFAGEPYTGSIRGVDAAGYVETHDSVLVARMRAAGAVCVGKTNTPELGLIPTTEPELRGPSRNPHDPTRSTGGSSGGSGAAVASGMVPVGHANDGGGSIRIPASECGLVGLKPSRGRIPQWPEVPEFWGGLVMQGFVTRTVRDTVLLYDVVTGPATGDLHTPPDLPVEDRPLRVGLYTSLAEVPTAPECVAAAELTARRLEGLGHTVEVAHPAALADPALTTWFLPCYAVWTAHDLDLWGTRIGRVLGPDDVELLTWTLAEMGRTVSGAQYVDALSHLHDYSRRVQSWWDDGWDLLVTPTIPEVPPPLGTFASAPDNPLGGVFRSSQVVPYCVPFNITGQPAISLPMHATDDGLPIGVQLVARYGADRLLLKLAADLEVA